MVEVYEGNMLFNKENELSYGKFLRKMADNDVRLISRRNLVIYIS